MRYCSTSSRHLPWNGRQVKSIKSYLKFTNFGERNEENPCGDDERRLYVAEVELCDNVAKANVMYARTAAFWSVCNIRTGGSVTVFFGHIGSFRRLVQRDNVDQRWSEDDCHYKNRYKRSHDYTTTGRPYPAVLGLYIAGTNEPDPVVSQLATAVPAVSLCSRCVTDSCSHLLLHCKRHSTVSA